ncbi:MAG TPA: FKBP-type peptidyl-prolyl cis-trans isomerase [Leptospiraceae bacterium]|nr:FKBP-type peptidyl-prolyl cis-trans isomerase [Leptospiraceae bacterium]
MFKILLVASLVAFSSISIGAQDVKDLIVKDVKVGTGKEAKDGNTVTVHYVGTLTNNKKFDSSRDRKQPFSFQLGRGEVIKGWDRGVKGMKIGGIRKLTIPSHLGYGERGAGADIPPNATLLFEVELMNVE